ncbi:TBC1 domain family member 5-like isoform X3 [Physella acuta]|uniref:TBC1 domain family member 5-like isoform X3 n=1 Tax=Physella acuta TaxID=109671 RepID=UPI0027DBC32D|nr:TBC1 domain family member 5-like isoform X3 [Physella acuta]
MDVFSKLRPSKSRKNSLPDHSTPPSKEEIINVLENYTLDKLNTKQEKNNNSDHLSRGSSLDYKGDMVEDETKSASASLSHSYSLEWDKLFHTKDMMKKLKERAMEGELRSSRFRSLVWKIFLEVLPPSMDEWIEKTRKSRAKFEELKNRLVVNPRKAVDSVDITLNNPLSQDEESPWNKFFQDNELRLTIKQDVIRTTFGKHHWKQCFPEVEFFRGPELYEMMNDILFCYSRELAQHSYKQGMHELLAPLIFVLHCDHQAFLHACEIESVLDIMKEVMDPAFLEHDAYTMFCQVMETVEPWYLSRDIFYNNPKTGSMRSLEIINATPFSRSQDLNPSSAIVTKLTRIQDYILKKYDPELHQHLERLEIAPQIYGIRWLRLLFGREFPMQDLLMLWDAIFGDGIGFDLVDYIFVSMLLYIREILLTNDYATCLTVLMKFPPVADVHYFVVKAIWLREPNHHPRPPSYTHQGSIRTSTSMAGSTDSISNTSSTHKDSTTTAQPSHNQGQKRQNISMGGFSSFSRKFSRPRTLSVPKSSSEPMNLQTDMSPETSNNPIGSTVSLSQVEESMFRHSAVTLSQVEDSMFRHSGRMEPGNLRSAQSSPGVHHSSIFPLTPDDPSITSSPVLPGKSKSKQKKLTKQEKDLEDKVMHLQGELNDKNSMCRYCASKLDVHIGRLQQELSRQNFEIDDDIMLSLAGLKLVRDILNGTLKFSQNIAADEEEIHINDDFYSSQPEDGYSCSTGITSPESDILLGVTSGADVDQKVDGRRARLFYMSSEEVSSPDSSSVAGQVRGGGGNDLGQFGDYEGNKVTNHETRERHHSGEKMTAANNSTLFSSKIRSFFKSDSPQHQPKEKQTAPSSGSRPSQNTTTGGHSFKQPALQQSENPSTFDLTHSNQVDKELISMDNRRRAQSNLETQQTYWPEFVSDRSSSQGQSAMSSHDPRDSPRRHGEYKLRERSKSQPSASLDLYHRSADEEEFGVNPLYKLRYHENMEH